jgi:hypothetical protein
MTVAPRRRFLIHGLAAWAVHLLTPDLSGQIEFILYRAESSEGSGCMRLVSALGWHLWERPRAQQAVYSVAAVGARAR